MLYCYSAVSLFFCTHSVIGPPENINLTTISGTSMYLSWEEPSEQGEEILGYAYSCYSRTATAQHDTVSDPNIRSVVFTGGDAGLSPYTLYTCSVAGFGASSQGAIASISRRSPENRKIFSTTMMCMNCAGMSNEVGLNCWYTVHTIFTETLQYENSKKAVSR